MTEPKAICAVPFCEGLTLRRGRRPHHVQRERIGTWETSSGPRSPWRSRTLAGTIWARRRGTAEESDAPRSTDEAPEQSRDGPGRQGLGGGGGRGGKGARSEEERTAAHVPDSAPDPACHRSWPRTDRGYGLQSLIRDHVRPSAGARCGKAARRDLCGGRRVIAVPTATRVSHCVSKEGGPTSISPCHRNACHRNPSQLVSSIASNFYFVNPIVTATTFATISPKIRNSTCTTGSFSK